MAFKEEFLLWKQSEVTTELMKSLFEQISRLSAEIVMREDSNPNRDTFVRGAIQSLIAVAEWEPTFPEVEVDNDPEI